MADPTAALSQKLEFAANEVEQLLAIPSNLISQLEAEIADIEHRHATVDKAIAGLQKELQELTEDQENACKKDPELTEDECRRLLPVMTRLTLAESTASEDGKQKVFVGKLDCSQDFVEKNWDNVSHALFKIN